MYFKRLRVRVMEFGRLGLAATFFLAAFACFLFSSGFASALTNVTACGTYSAANETFALNQSVNGSSGICITISGENATLDCKYYGVQYNVSGTHTGGSVGIYGSAFNFTVKNCILTDFENPIAVTSANCTIYNNTIYDTNSSYTYCGQYPTDETIQLNSGSDYANVSYNTIYRTWIGIEPRASNYVKIAFNTINQTWMAVYLHYTLPYDQYANVSYNNLTQNAYSITGQCNNCTYAFNNVAVGKPLPSDPEFNYGIVLGLASSGSWGVYNNNTVTTMPNTHSRGFLLSGLGLGLDYIYSNDTVDGKQIAYYGIANQPCINNSVFDLSTGNTSVLGFIGCTGVTVENNNFTSFQGIDGYAVSNSVVKNNFFTNGVEAIQFRSGSNNTVLNNTFYNTSTSLYVISETGLNASYNNFTSNKHATVSLTGTNIVFSNNRVVDSEGGMGVVYGSGTSSTLTNVTLSNNVILNPSLDPSLPSYGYGAGIAFYCYSGSATGVTLYNNTVYNGSRQSAYLIGVYNASLADNNFSRTNYGDGYQDLYLTSSSSAWLLNTSFNKSSVGFGDVTSNLTCNWYLDVHAVDSCGFDAGGAVVNASNVNSSLVFSQTANSTGWIARQNVTEYFQNSSGVFNFTPHLFNASASGLSGAVARNVSVDATKTVVFLFADGSRCPGGGTALSCGPCVIDGVCQACCASDPDCVGVTPSPTAVAAATAAPTNPFAASPSPAPTPTAEVGAASPSPAVEASFSPSTPVVSGGQNAVREGGAGTGFDWTWVVGLLVLVILAGAYYYSRNPKRKSL